MQKFELPYPPSVNSYWGFSGSRRYLTKKAVEFKKIVYTTVSTGKPYGKARLSIHIKLSPPDKRVRDIDNCLKSLLDALCQAGMFDDDSQIDRIYLVRDQVIKFGKCVVILKRIGA
jgi:crossover junction endodeoxyribonuclease RusA